MNFDFATPEEAWNAVHIAMNAKDALAVYNCYAEVDQKQILGSLAFELQRLIDFGAPGAAEASRILEKNQLHDFEVRQKVQAVGMDPTKQNKVFETIGRRIKEPSSFVKEADKIIAAVPHFRSESLYRKSFPRIENIRITGEEAEAQVVESEPGLEFYVSLKKEGGYWRVSGRNSVEASRTLK